MDLSIPQVSICCITYNHAKYISDCLEGFLSQITTFPFEILIHDDASTDGTQTIIREYQARFPEIIKPILQVVNQYSQGNNVITINCERAVGKYIALCEGDDFWCNHEKLQQQFDFMEEHPDYCMCGCSRWHLDQQKKMYYPMLQHIYDDFPCAPPKTTKSLFLGVHPFHTAGLFFRTDSFIKIKHKFERDSIGAAMGDALLLFHLSLAGNIKYMPQMMTVYRLAPNSAMAHHDSGQAKIMNQRMFETAIRLAKNNGYDDWNDELLKKREIENAIIGASYPWTKKTFRRVISFIKHLLAGDFWRYWRYTRQSPYERVRYFVK